MGKAIPIIQILCYAGAIQAISSMCSVVNISNNFIFNS